MTATGSKARPAAGPGRDQVLEKAVAELSAADPVLSGLASRHGPPRLERAHDAGRADGHFADLVRSVLYQQLAGRAAAAIHARLVAAAGPAVTPDALLELGHDRLRGVGLSGAKTATLIGLAEAVSSGRLDLGTIADLDDDQVVATLSALRGIGPWTAEMFCMFRLGRLDVWPVTDYGVRKGYALAWSLPELPTPAALRPLGDPYRPWRSVVAWYCWRAAETVLPAAPLPAASPPRMGPQPHAPPKRRGPQPRRRP